MERSWSSDAEAAFAAYPWRSEEERSKAREEAELVSFGARVEVDDLPLRVRKFVRTARRPRHEWRGESWDDAVAEFERDVIGQALAANGGSVAAAARALKTTPRVVAYTARKRGLK